MSLNSTTTPTHMLPLPTTATVRKLWRFVDLEDIDLPNSAGKLNSGEGYIRLRIDGSAGVVHGETTYSQIFGWFEHTVGLQCESSSDPFVKKEAFSGAIDSVNSSANTVNVATAVGTGDLSSVIDLSKAYYLEVVAGDHTGHRFELDENATLAGDGSTLHVNTDTSESTSEGHYNTDALADLSNLAGDTVVLRQHRTLGEVLPEALFNDTDSHSTADRVLFLNSASGYDICWMYDGSYDAGAPDKRWVARGDATLADQGPLILVRPPCEGFFVHPRGGTVTKQCVGIVRQNQLVCPLRASWNFIGNPWPVDRHPAPDQAGVLPDNATTVNDLGMTSANGFTGDPSRRDADQIQAWLADDPAFFGVEGFDGYYLLDFDLSGIGLGDRDHWTKVDETDLSDDNTAPVLRKGRSIFLKMIHPIDQWTILPPQ